MAEPKLVVFLYLFVVASLADVCQKKICSCTYEPLKKNSGRKYHRVNCRRRGLTQVFPSSELPKNTQILDLAKNSIRVIKRGFLDDHFKLERLYLQKNKIKLLEEKAFVGLNGLKVLNIGQNKLKNLEARAFLGLRELNILDLKHNEIKNIDKDAFVGLESLTKLNLRNSSLSTIANGTLRGLSTLKKIDIKHNPLLCDCRLNWLSLYLTRKGAPKVVGTCVRRNVSKKLTFLKKVDLCEKPPELRIYPSKSQIVAIGDRFRIKCEVVSKQKRRLKWTKNHTFFPPKRLKILKEQIGFNETLYVEFVSITMEDLGLYTCVGEGLVPKAITVQVVTSKKKMCLRYVTNGNNEAMLPEEDVVSSMPSTSLVGPTIVEPQTLMEIPMENTKEATYESSSSEMVVKPSSPLKASATLTTKNSSKTILFSFVFIVTVDIVFRGAYYDLVQY